MADSTIATPPRHDVERAHSNVGVGRLSVYTALGALTGVVPLPFIPDTLARRVRGALVHDIAARHGLSLSKEARALLADTSGPDAPRGVLKQAATFVVKKLLARVGPIALVSPLRDALGTYVLGYLFERYVEHARSDRSVRIDIDEARRVRIAIDRALVHAFTVVPDREQIAFAPEELRDATTQLTDGLLQVLAALPEVLVRHLDAAFDELIPQRA
jgi:hypothetical protein